MEIRNKIWCIKVVLFDISVKMAECVNAVHASSHEHIKIATEFWNSQPREWSEG